MSGFNQLEAAAQAILDERARLAAAKAQAEAEAAREKELLQRDISRAILAGIVGDDAEMINHENGGVWYGEVRTYKGVPYHIMTRVQPNPYNWHADKQEFWGTLYVEGEIFSDGYMSPDAYSIDLERCSDNGGIRGVVNWIDDNRDAQRRGDFQTANTAEGVRAHITADPVTWERLGTGVGLRIKALQKNVERYIDYRQKEDADEKERAAARAAKQTAEQTPESMPPLTPLATLTAAMESFINAKIERAFDAAGIDY